MTRFAVIAASVAVVAAACGGSKSDDKKDASGGSGGALTGRGPITLATGKDTSGNLQNLVNTWNQQHPKEQARIIELPEDADAQRQQMVQNAQTKSNAYSVLNLDVVWTAEFAANRWIAQLPKDQFDLSKFLPAATKTGEYRNNLYAAPWKTDSGLLYYRKDQLDKAGIKEPPKTWAEMQQDCSKIKGFNCYAGQFEKYEGLTVNFSEAVNSAGGQVVDDSGKPNVNTPQAKQGLDFLVNGFKSGMIPKEAISFKEEESRRAFEKGNLLFYRQWPYAYALSNKKGDSKVVGKFAVAPLPGLNGPGAPTLGGHNLAISQFTPNKATALDFIKYLTSEQTERANLIASSEAPTLASLYDDQELQKKFPYLPTLKASLLNAKPRPQVVRYNDVTTAIEEAAYSALTGKSTTDQALADLQNKLGQLITP
ncbi:ABC transporter substrate-binding protein [Actinoallomurus rhizosphaericola]|uniref:ABC transporter substrate-binding protein n=1 Tax=Actinoallomurus rhizosphaericola TaxID=2952536 RepID=UPI002092C6DC|nr:ABC transporter substrate-binding protein [Actinoallomurus rhizosphaericola]MCO5998173.1 ABC transporter substrate-binding protein [Actinoallomurus rhizosphaericola]